MSPPGCFLSLYFPDETDLKKYEILEKHCGFMNLQETIGRFHNNLGSASVRIWIGAIVDVYDKLEEERARLNNRILSKDIRIAELQLKLKKLEDENMQLRAVRADDLLTGIPDDFCGGAFDEGLEADGDGLAFDVGGVQREVVSSGGNVVAGAIDAVVQNVGDHQGVVSGGGNVVGNVGEPVAIGHAAGVGGVVSGGGNVVAGAIDAVVQNVGDHQGVVSSGGNVVGNVGEPVAFCHAAGVGGVVSGGCKAVGVGKQFVAFGGEVIAIADVAILNIGSQYDDMGDDTSESSESASDYVPGNESDLSDSDVSDSDSDFTHPVVPRRSERLRRGD